MDEAGSPEINSERERSPVPVVTHKISKNGVSLLSRNQTKEVTVLVTGINRYIVDHHYLCVMQDEVAGSELQFNYESDMDYEEHEKTQKTETTPYEAYDLTVSDGAQSIKCALLPRNNKLIETGHLTRGVLIKIIEYKILYDEKVIGGGDGFTCINKLQVLNTPDGIIEDMMILLPEFESVQKPITGGRGCYSPLYDDDNFEFPLNKVQESAGELPNTIPLAHAVESSKLGSCVLGRIAKKSKIMHYAKKGEDFKYPMFYTFVLVDDSMEKGVPVAVWNKLALETYASLEIGDIVLVQDFRVKNYYDSGLFPSETSFKSELALNTKKSTIHKVKQVQVMDLELPVVSFRSLHFKPDNSFVNIMGIVVSISDYYREKSHKMERLKFAQYNYITLLDSSTTTPVTCKVYTNSRKSTQDQVQLGHIVCITDLRVQSITVNSLLTDRHMTLTSSPSTSVLLETSHLRRKPLIRAIGIDPFRKLGRFRSEQKALALFTRSNIKYDLSFNDIPNFTLYEAHFMEQLIFFKDLFKMTEELVIKETKTICIQARIKSIHGLGEEPPKKKKRTSMAQSSHVTIVLENLNRNTTIDVTLRLFEPIKQYKKENASKAALVFERLVHEDIVDYQDDEASDEQILNVTVVDELYVLVLRLHKQSRDETKYELLYGFPSTK